MSEFDFDEIEEELDLVIPDVYRMFVDAVVAQGYDLEKHRIYHNTETLLKGNWLLREQLGDATPPWQDHYLDFGVGDGCGNYFFLIATDEEDDIVQLWAHDPSGIEDVSSGTDFFRDLMAELKLDFDGPNKYRFDGNRHWD